MKRNIDAKATLEALVERAREGAKYAEGPIRVLTCLCGRGVATELTEGSVECACGRAFDLASRRHVVATVPPARRRGKRG